MKLYSWQKQRVGSRRLERRNALKNVDYEASTSPSSSFHHQSAHRTRSLDIPSSTYRTSFRVEGTEGELDLICRSLGLSGPDDFAISTADWENRRSYSPTGASLLSTSSFYHSNLRSTGESAESDLSVSFGSRISFSDDKVNTDGACSTSAEFGEARVLLTNGVCTREDDINVGGIKENGRGIGNEYSEISNDERFRVLEDGSGDKTRESESGIKCFRPLLLAPPPGMSHVIVDDLGSNWDLIMSFAPRGDEDLTNDAIANFETSVMMKSRIDTIVSPSDSNMLGDEDTIIAIEPQYRLSPNGLVRGSFKNWQKGDFLGSGSFGTVYEGYNE